MNTQLNLTATIPPAPAPASGKPPAEYLLVRALPTPDVTHHIECGCKVGIGLVDGHSVLLDVVDHVRNEDGSMTVVVDLHDCDFARKRAESREHLDRRSDAVKRLTRTLAERMRARRPGGDR